MSFTDAGFLTSDDSAQIAQIRQRHASWFAFIDKVNRFAMSLLLVERPRVREELFAATMFARAVTLFQGAVLMAERGMATEARTLVRGCAESAIALWGTRLDQTFIARLAEDDDKYRIATANDLLTNLPPDDPHISAEQRASLWGVIDEVSNRYTRPHPLRINWAVAAIKARLVPLYLTVYRRTSSDAAHVSLRALERHVAFDAQEEITGFCFQPDIEGVPNTLTAAIGSLLHATEAKLYGLSNAAANEKVRSLTREWGALNSALNRSNGGPEPALA
jgi:hypothetical protein